MVEDTQKRYADDVTLQELVRLRVENDKQREGIERLRGERWNALKELEKEVLASRSEIERLREALRQIKQQSMETHTRATAHQALHQNEARILATNTYEAEGKN